MTTESVKDKLRDKGFLPAQEVAEKLGVTRQTVYNWEEAGHIYGERLGAAHWVEWKSVLAYLKQTSPQLARMAGVP